jgi:hypothetical protein
MNASTSLVITSIASDQHPVLNLYAKECVTHNMSFIVAGDTKSPGNFKIDHCEFLDVEIQQQLPFDTARLIPHKHYSKKNIAYLQAIKNGAEIIVETDDDNIPLPGFWDNRNCYVQGHMAEYKNWVNVYSYFSDTNIWPRGFSLKHLSQPNPPVKDLREGTFFCPVQQGLANENPDVDAIYRLTAQLPVYFKDNHPIILGNHSLCPFNSQNTTWFKEAFALMYLPSYCSFRMTDIWRSFVTQRILWTCGWNMSFHNATVYQQRNEHDLMKDFEEEISGYVHNEGIIADLMHLNLKHGKEHLFENLLACYKKIIEKQLIDEKELVILGAWINDIKKLTE